ncbi:mannose transmembrane transport [Mactra antiquata]
MVKHLLIFLFAAFLVLVSTAEQKDCTFPRYKSNDKRKKGEDQIELLKGRRYQFEDKYYKYHVGICTDAMDPYPEDKKDVWTDAAVIQINKTNSEDAHVIGKITEADIIAGPDWVMLEYNNGEKYGTHCEGQDGNNENRRAKIMFICDHTVDDGEPYIIEEQNGKTESCYYLFGFDTQVVCKTTTPKVTVKSGLSVGSVLLIVFVCVAGVYLLAGLLYNRFVVHAKGIEQIPNLSFWRDFGNLQADGCDLVCRSGRSREPRTYKGIGDDQLGEDEPITSDEHLLPM